MVREFTSGQYMNDKSNYQNTLNFLLSNPQLAKQYAIPLIEDKEVYLYLRAGTALALSHLHHAANEFDLAREMAAEANVHIDFMRSLVDKDEDDKADNRTAFARIRSWADALHDHLAGDISEDAYLKSIANEREGMKRCPPGQALTVSFTAFAKEDIKYTARKLKEEYERSQVVSKDSVWVNMKFSPLREWRE